MIIQELKRFLDAELEKAEINHQETLKRHEEIMDACERMENIGEKMIDTNMGTIPIEDYRDIVAMQNGFDSYEDLLAEGYSIDV